MGCAPPFVFDTSINGQSFFAWITQCLVPTPKPSDIVILDNLGSHKSQAVRQAIRAVGGAADLPAAV